MKRNDNELCGLNFFMPNTSFTSNHTPSQTTQVGWCQYLQIFLNSISRVNQPIPIVTVVFS